jgi:DNA repair protein RadA
VVLLENSDEVIKENDIRLIIVDSVTSHFRSEYLGREMLAPRQQELNKHLHKLIRLSRSFNTAVVVTNQVMAQPDAFFAKMVKPVGGHVMGHTSHTRVFLRKGRNNLRIAKLVVSPFLPEGETPLRITERGVEGDDDI